MDHAFDRIPHAFARAHLLLWLQVAPDGRHVVAHSAHSDPIARHNAAVRLCGDPERVDWQERDGEALATAIDAAYEAHAARTATRADGTRASAGMAEAALADSSSERDAAAELERSLAQAERDLLSTQGKAPLIQLVDRILFDCLSRGASDIHLQPTADSLLIRRRVDGVLDAGQRVSIALHRPLASRIKVMARLDVAEQLVPQDGRASVTIGTRSIDLRISTIPTAYGERIVIRLLDRTRQPAALAELGMPDEVAAAFAAASMRANGLVLVTGPTGSGKTTTLYAALRALDSTSRNLMTIEDPIEYELSGDEVRVSQAQVNLKKGVSFATGLRHILRQDPDVIMVGEIRDAETAKVAIQAALTGHLVFSTLHTNDALTAVTRLTDLGIEPYLIADALSLVLAQRLVRTCCRMCGGSGRAGGDAACATCAGSGMKGRTGLFEMAVIDQECRERIAARATLDEMRLLARQRGWRTLSMEGQRLVADGRSTAAEVARVVNS